MVGLAPIEALMYTQLASGLGLVYLFIPFMVTAIYLSLVNFNFELLEVAKINGARPWRAFVEITWPLNWIGTAIGIVLVFIPCLANALTPRFLGGPNGDLVRHEPRRSNSARPAPGRSARPWASCCSCASLLVDPAASRRPSTCKRSGFTGAMTP